MKYRSEIDGLRGISVLAVILAHANFSIFGGGFIGVDVFFVISGYLITSIILSEYKENEFSLIRFYERRAKRILPALCLVLVCSIPFAWMWLLPDAYEAFSKSLMMATLSLSNLHFMRRNDYFAPDAAEVPLLHTWSLGVEEQFYLLFPLLFLFKLKTKTILRVVMFVAVASLVLSEFGARYFPSANYYLLPTRAWEILVGALCAFYISDKGKPTSGLFACLGLASIASSVFLFDASARFPSLIALLPVGGAALFLLFSSGETSAGRLLSTRPLVWIGRISFSAYLWHQPVFAFWRIRSPEPPSQLVMMGLILLVFSLAALSWYYVEQPFRRKAVSTKHVVRAVLSGVVVFVGFGAWGDIKEGLPFRLTSELRSFIDKTTWSKKCLFQVKDGMPSLPDEKCVFNTAAASGETYAVWGDSIGASISPALLHKLEPRHIRLLQLTHGLCAPIDRVSIARDPAAANCEIFNQRAIDYLVKSDVDTVVMAASWVNFLNARHMEIDDREFSGVDITVAEIADNLRETVEALQASGKRVIVVYPTPRFSKPIVDIMARDFIKGDATPDFEYPYSRFKAETQCAYAVLDTALPEGVLKVVPEAIFCSDAPSQPCYFGRHGVAFIADRSHYTEAGAQLIVDRIVNSASKSPTPTASLTN
ncbi:O-acetyltransferase OatA [Agrobacterium sp. DSM 25558]|uniref:acyltransferase family protein n=1 Tax=Agrobacterium sp. DSM 25558 TaxID=1907665 RepID=UPI0009724FE0|nr:acyltransferase family protein [Agrobacterium sp. DSM 25558]SCX28137.1 O-acetyltransferase OatA [Agrobacterium sp. DSM 25558]